MQELYQDESGKWCKRTIADTTESNTATEPTAEDKARQRIAELEEQLRSNDYKVIKCFEAQATGGKMPYDIAKLHAERESKRAEINALQKKFNV